MVIVIRGVDRVNKCEMGSEKVRKVLWKKSEVAVERLEIRDRR